MGPNGAGKTTLFNLVSGIYPATRGKILFYGQDISRYPIHRRAALGIARTYQVTNLFRCLTRGRKHPDGLSGPGQIEVRHVPTPLLLPLNTSIAATRCSKKFDLWEKRNELVKNLSHGDQRRIEVAMALAEKPRLLLLDEPAAGSLPMRRRRSCRPLLKRLDPSITILMIEHDLDVAFEFAEKITVLYQGKFLTEGTKEEIKNNPVVHEIYLGAE